MKHKVMPNGTEYDFNDAGQVTHEKCVDGAEYDYEYNDAGILTHERWADGSVRDFDADGQMTHTTYLDGAERWYDSDGNVTHEKCADGTEYDYDHDTNGYLMHEKSTKGSLSVISLNYWLKDNGITEADVDFNDADLSSIVLSGCKFHGLTLHGINFQGCRLNEVSFRGASLHNCTFKHSFLNACTFRDASLDCCDMSSALIVRTDFIGARAEETSFSDACIAKGNRFSASVMQSPGLRQICPATGAFDAWKIVYVERIPHLIHLRVPENALRSSATSRRCRCSEAKVISIRNLCTHESVNSVTNISYCPCVYTVGKIATPDHFNENRWDECSHGIHVLLTEREAIAYANGLLGARASGWKV